MIENMARSFVLIVLILFSTMAEADLIVRSPSYSASEFSVVRQKLNDFFSRYVEKHSEIDAGYKYSAAKIGGDYLSLYSGSDAKSPERPYEVFFAGKAYLMAVISFNPLLKAEPHCMPNDSALPNGHCEWIARQRSVCHVFLLNPRTFDLESVAALDVARDPRLIPGKTSRKYQDIDERFMNDPRQVEGWPACDQLFAVGSVKGGADFLLFSIGYRDSAAPANKSEDEYQLKMTTKLSFVEDAQGHVKMVQDDACLGNPNTYTTIAAARKALNACVARKR